ncbi:MAG: DUF1588 domain-containing protein [Verrucomicrobiota bacterium]
MVEFERTARRAGLFLFLALLPTGGSGREPDAAFFEDRVLPLMEATCIDCHDVDDSRGDVPFMEARTLEDVASMREVWRSVAAQLRNRTMPPPKKKQPEEAERVAVSQWIEGYLRKTALSLPPHAGHVVARRLNRLEFDLTVQDLFGVALGFAESLPMETGGGEGFDNDGQTLYLPPILLERFLEAGQQVVDASIITPALDLAIPRENWIDDQSALVAIHVEGDYEVVAPLGPADCPGTLIFQVDGVEVEKRKFEESDRLQEKRVRLRLARGNHLIGLSGGPVTGIRILQQSLPPDEETIAAHRSLLGLDPGTAPPEPARAFARARLAAFLPRAYRRPVRSEEMDRLMALYDRAAERGDPFEERMKLVFKGLLISPDFLFRIEKDPGKGLHRLNAHELAVRLSYFLWARPPDEALIRLATSGTLLEPGVLTAQVDRMLSDARSLVFARAFVGQWLGTKDVGGRIAPVHNTKERGYTNAVAADLREEGVRFFHHLIEKNRPVFELVDSDFALLTGRLVDYYGVPVTDKPEKEVFEKVVLENRNRGGLLGMGAVLALTSHPRKTSPVLRGAWVFDTLIGSPVPPPPTEVPALSKSRKKGRTEREALEEHRDRAACMACHRIIDPIGFGLENFDRLGRWRDQRDGQAVDATGELPTGERFQGPAEMKAVLLATQSDLILRQVIRKLLGYGLGRHLGPEDDGTIERLAAESSRGGYGLRDLIHGIVRSVPFQNSGTTLPSGSDPSPGVESSQP